MGFHAVSKVQNESKHLKEVSKPTGTVLIQYLIQYICLMNGPNFKWILYNPLYGEATGTKESKSQKWQGSFPKAIRSHSQVMSL